MKLLQAPQQLGVLGRAELGGKIGQFVTGGQGPAECLKLQDGRHSLAACGFGQPDFADQT